MTLLAHSLRMQSYHNLRVAARAREVVKATYQVTGTFPKVEQFGMTAQMRRAAISAALNIVEGCSRRSTAELIRFLELAVGSAMELEFCCTLARDLELGLGESGDQLCTLNQRLQRELAALIGSLRARKRAGSRE